MGDDEFEYVDEAYLDDAAYEAHLTVQEYMARHGIRLSTSGLEMNSEDW